MYRANSKFEQLCKKDVFIKVLKWSKFKTILVTASTAKNICFMKFCWNAGCCPKMTVVNSANPELNGEYLLQGEEEEKPEEICVDGCIYTKDGDEYCFILTNQGSVECQVWTHDISGLGMVLDRI